MRLKVNASDLLHWARYYDELPRHTKPAIARALNTYGSGVVEEIVRQVAAKNNWDPDQVRQRIIVKPADADDLTYKMDASLVVPQSQSWNRPWQTRDNSAFEQNTLVKVITVDDGFDCDICRQIAAEGPYTMQQVNDMQARWADYTPPTPNIHPGTITNLVHPRCRCTTQPWSSYRRLPVAFQGQSGSVGAAPTRLFTMKQLGKALQDELSVTIRAVRRGY